MKQVRTVALSRTTAASFLPLTEPEVVKLRQVPAWMRWLYLELVGLSDFRTGAGRSSWAQLVSLLDWDKPERGRRAAAELGLQQVRRAFEQLAGLGLIARDKGRNEQTGWLFFQVAPRTGLGASAGKTDRVSDRARKPRSTRESRPQDTGNPTGFPTAGTGSKYTPSPQRLELSPDEQARCDRLQAIADRSDAAAFARATRSTGLPPKLPGTKPPAAVRELVAAQRAARGEIKAPQGGRTIAPAGQTPPGLAPPKSAQADFSPPGQRDKGRGARPVGEFLPAMPAEG